MQYILMVLVAAGIVVADQLTKSWIVHNLRPGIMSEAYLDKIMPVFHLAEDHFADLPSEIPGIPGIFKITHHFNDGAAWSSFSGMTWLFLLVFAALTAAVIWELWKKKMNFSTFDRWCIVCIWAGGLGNMIDRVRQVFVVDMITLEFMDFPIFNVADCFISCGCVALLISLVFFNRKFWKDDKKKCS